MSLVSSPILVALVALGAGLAFAGEPADGERAIVKEVVIAAPVETVWHAWTTEDGLRFISEKSRVELRPGGPYEWFLDLEPDESGRRGGEGARINSFVPHERLEFSWTFPPAVPTLRRAGETTHVTLTFEDLGEEGTRVHFEQRGWRQGDDWDAGFAYFDRAWGFVLDRLKATLENAPPES
jgi:uncharacterized protein YndB with AHSA1/START domain